MPSASVIVPWLYVALPVASAALAFVRSRRLGNANPLRNMFVTSIAGAVGGLGLVVLYMRLIGGHVAAAQMVTACYWGIAVATALRVFNAVLTWTLRRVVRLRTNEKACCPAAGVIGAVIHAALMLAIIVSYIAAMAVTYRVRIVNPQTPASVLGVDYQTLSFTSTDGMQLRGWWIPAVRTARTDDEQPAPAWITRTTRIFHWWIPRDDRMFASPDWGRKTVIFCHGFGADKASQLGLVRDLVPNGFNVLAFDFRAHGESAGQLTTFGDLERRDVLGAVRWVREHHPMESERIFGLGGSLGAAALIGAAGDPSAEGQAIEAIAVFAPFDRLTMVAQDMANSYRVPLAGWIVRHLALPVAGAQLGTSLAHFSPADEIDKLAPRPIFVIATVKDRDVDMARSQALFEQASAPKYAYWIKKTGRGGNLLENEKASIAIRVFFEMARPML